MNKKRLKRAIRDAFDEHVEDVRSAVKLRGAMRFVLYDGIGLAIEELRRGDPDAALARLKRARVFLCDQAGLPPVPLEGLNEYSGAMGKEEGY